MSNEILELHDYLREKKTACAYSPPFFIKPLLKRMEEKDSTQSAFRRNFSLERNVSIEWYRIQNCKIMYTNKKGGLYMSLAYNEYGNLRAPLLIFIHGGGVGGWMWDKQVRYFSNYHVIVPELNSPGSASSFTIAACADCLISLIEEKRQTKPVIAIGFSLGAQVLLAALGKKPDLVDYAMLNSALVKPVPFKQALIKSAVFFQPLAKSRSFSRIQAKSLYIGEAYYSAYYRDSSRIKKQELSRLLSENMSFALPENFKTASADILVTAGEQERGLIKASMRDIVKNNPNCRGIVFPDIGHGISLAKPELFNCVIDRWLSDRAFPGQVMELND